jgi:hypothetical protein
MIQYTYNSGYNQKWHIIPCADGSYRIDNVNSLGKSIEVADSSTANGAGVVLGDFAFFPNQQWYIIPVQAASRQESTVQLSEERDSNVVTGYPNPFKEKAYIAVSLSEPSNVTVDVLNTSGIKAKTFSFGTLPAGTHELELDGKELRAGIYVYKTLINGKLTTGKLVKTD